VAESKKLEEVRQMWFAEHDVPRESGADDGETVPRRAEIVDDAVLRQLDRTFVSAFWWLTVYELASSLLDANLLNRYVSNSVDPKSARKSAVRCARSLKGRRQAVVSFIGSFSLWSLGRQRAA
jgi:hypothetical protein